MAIFPHADGATGLSTSGRTAIDLSGEFAPLRLESRLRQAHRARKKAVLGARRRAGESTRASVKFPA